MTYIFLLVILITLYSLLAIGDCADTSSYPLIATK